MSEIITIDGPASSGKSTVGVRFAQRIGYRFIDSGLLFRAAALVSLRRHILPEEEERLAKEMEGSRLEFAPDGVEIFLNGEDVTSFMHTPEVTALVFYTSEKAAVREAIRKVLRKVGLAQNTVMAGRDIGSVIFPEAKLKFYVTAFPEVRARRRFEQMVARGESVHYAVLLKTIKERDKHDSNRAVAPLKIPKGAIVVDTSRLTIEEAAGRLFAYFVRSNIV